MGRTNPTYRDTIRALEDDWGEYRRALRRVDQPHFDRLFEHGRTHADAAGYLNHQEPETAFLLSVILEQEKQLQLLEKRVQTLETILDSEYTAESIPTSTGRG